ncbi:LisH domain-containing protein armc9 [Physocladia obscura]|uniref:LisH domain-containing protein armc9 n=1 Tax=Physocladia obscura TaxID=109957 RepID=A0AAD5X9Z9_9FUNG|nr:LisH domain-containing protein armc9 [Physocladia obscura]
MLLDSTREIETNALIREYFNYADYRATANAFDVECGLKGRIPAEEENIIDEENPEALTKLEESKNRFLIAFHDGDRKQFFALWDKHFPSETVKTDPLYSKIEFQISIYFAVFPIHPYVNPVASKRLTIKSTMDAFKTFLETRGAELCKTTQFLPFYALPYVPNARAHPSFNEIFTQRHATDLESRLNSFLSSALRASHVPRLLKILGGVDMRSLEQAKEKEAEIRMLTLQLHDFQDTEREILTKHRGLQRDYHNLLTIASELVQTIAACINGEKITSAYLSSICQRVAEFKRKTTTGLSAPRANEKITNDEESISVGKTSLIIETSHQTSHERQETMHESSDSYTSRLNDNINSSIRNELQPNLNFGAILHDLTPTSDNNTSRRQAFILQALRRKLSNGAEKRSILKTYIEHDFLGVLSGHGIVIPLIQTGSYIVREQFARLLNTISSECIGRDYLLGTETRIISILVDAMMAETKDSLYQQNLLGTLQKLSLRRSAQTIMNNMNMLEFLHNFLESSDSLSDYTCEYGTALFMNLCLRTDGRKQCLKNPVKTLETLLNLLEIDSMQIQTYVNGALYSLLSEKEFRNCAKQLRLEDSLRFLQNSANEQVKGQIKFVLEQLSSAISVESASEDSRSEDGDDEDEENDEDDIDQEQEEDFDDLFPQNRNEKSGDDALLPYCRVNNVKKSASQISGGLVGNIDNDETQKIYIATSPERNLSSRSSTPKLIRHPVVTASVPWPKDTEMRESVSKEPEKKAAGASKRITNVPTTEKEFVENSCYIL